MKNEAIEVLMNRRSVRKFKPDQITDEELRIVLDAGTYAPTARNQQRPWIVAVQDKETRDALAALNTRISGRPNEQYYGAPTLIFVLAPDDEFGPLDASAVETNMLNAAYAVGLGSCWIHRCRQMFELPEGKALLKQWGLPQTLVGVASVALGYAACEPPVARPRKADYIVKV